MSVALPHYVGAKSITCSQLNVLMYNILKINSLFHFKYAPLAHLNDESAKMPGFKSESQIDNYLPSKTDNSLQTSFLITS